MKIRPTLLDDDPAIIRAKNEEYFRFLEQQDLRAVPCLLTYFGRDFFHDGRLSEFRFSDDLRTFQFRAIADFGILPGVESEDRVGLSAWGRFTCIFFDVALFRASEMPRSWDSTRNLEETVCYSCGEINTLQEEIREYSAWHGYAMYSLSVETSPAHRSFDLVFSDVKVTPDEPIAFHLMEQSGKYRINLAHQGGMRRRTLRKT